MGPGLDIPNFFIFAINVVRFSPSRAAAPRDPPTIQPDACNVFRIKARWESRSVPSCTEGKTTESTVITSFALIRLESQGGKGFGSTPFLERITARSISSEVPGRCRAKDKRLTH